ncbi:MAG: N-carbamoyl-L-amino-acid hydrolase [Candidatus Poriferisodalaceae bacterium]|jgi:N-carbamoyl-L-amino-acid hydrolase
MPEIDSQPTNELHPNDLHPNDLQIDGERLWATLHELAEIGATPAGGVARVALTDVDRIGRDRFVEWATEVGCSIHIDRMGNLFARREGSDPLRDPVVIGSHLDSQPTGGKFDGAYGVMVGLEILRVLEQADHLTAAPIEVVSWTNEEGARFPPAMIGSGVFGGAFSLEAGLGATAADGARLGEELARIGYSGQELPGARPIGFYLEPHIEQGPILEAGEHTIGIVTGVQGIRWYDVEVTGKESHAGTTPMERRSDAMVSAARLVAAADDIARRRLPDGRSTVGVLTASPGSRNTIAGHATMTVDLRHPDPDELERMNNELFEAAAALDPAPTVEQIWYSPPITFDPDIVDALRQGATDLGLAPVDITSGAGHDACYISRIAPTGMVFIPCEDGLSHNEAENITAPHSLAGAEVTLQAVLRLAR